MFSGTLFEGRLSALQLPAVMLSNFMLKRSPTWLKFGLELIHISSALKLMKPVATTFLTAAH